MMGRRPGGGAGGLDEEWFPRRRGGGRAGARGRGCGGQDGGDCCPRVERATLKQVCCLRMEILPHSLRSCLQDHSRPWVDSHSPCSHSSLIFLFFCFRKKRVKLRRPRIRVRRTHIVKALRRNHFYSRRECLHLRRFRAECKILPLLTGSF